MTRETLVQQTKRGINSTYSRYYGNNRTEPELISRCVT